MDRKGRRRERGSRCALHPRHAVACRFWIDPERRANSGSREGGPGAGVRAFTDHFRAAPGVKGRQNDWDATWRNWCRRAPDFKPHVNGTAASHSSLLQQPQTRSPGGRTWKPVERLAFETILGEMFAAIDKPLGDAKIRAF